jgi:hypothetical protein
MSRLSTKMAPGTDKNGKGLPREYVFTPLHGVQKRRDVMREALLACGDGATYSDVCEWINVHYGDTSIGTYIWREVRTELLRSREIEPRKIIDWRKIEEIKAERKAAKPPADQPNAKEGIPDDYELDDDEGDDEDKGETEELEDITKGDDHEENGKPAMDTTQMVITANNDLPKAVDNAASGKPSTAGETSTTAGETSTYDFDYAQEAPGEKPPHPESETPALDAEQIEFLRRVSKCIAFVREIGSPSRTIAMIKALDKEGLLK